MRPLIVVLALAFFVAAACLWLWIEDRLDERELAAAARGSATRYALRVAELDADRAAELAFQRQVAVALDRAEYFCRFEAHERGLLRLDDPALPKRPGPPAAGADD